MEPQLELYYLELRNKKMFIYASTSLDESAIFLECKVLFDYVRNNPPIRVLHRTQVADCFEVDCYVKKNMKMFGIDNIRGGTYSMEIIPEFLLKGLELEFSEDNAIKLKALDEIKQQLLTNDIENIKIQTSIDTYNETKNKLNKLRNYNGQTIDRSIITDLETLSNCSTDYMIDTQTYNRILLRLRALYQIFTKNIDKPLDDNLFYNNPQHILDLLFYHTPLIDNMEKVENDKRVLLEKFEYMAYSIINKIEEYEFDLTTYPDNFDMYGIILDT